MRTYALIILLASAVLVTATCSTTPAWAAPAQPDTVQVTITSEPPGATVAIDRKLVGKTPLTVIAARGRHLIRVSINENWLPYIEEKDLQENQTLQVTLLPHTSYLYEGGKKSFEAGDFAAARNYFKQATETKDPAAIPESYFYLGIIAKKTGDKAGMERNLKKYLELNPTRGDFVFTFPQIDKETNNYAVSVSQYLLGDFYRLQNQWDKAATAYKLSIPRWQRFPDTGMQISYNNIRHLKDLTAKEKTDYVGLIKLGYIYEMKGMLKDAMFAYQMGAQVLFNQSPEFEEKMGNFMR